MFHIPQGVTENSRRLVQGIKAQYLFGGRCQVLFSLLLLRENLLFHVLGIAGQAVGVEVVVALGLCEGFPLLWMRKGI